MIPGFVISILTFPGVIMHEMAHQLFCRLFRIAIFDVCYFRFGNPAGYVVHEIPRSAYQNIGISIGPFIVNSVVGAIIAAPAALPIIQFQTGTLLDWFLIWLGVSIAMHAFPSTGDANSIWKSLWSKDVPLPAKLLGAPIVMIIFVGAVGSVVWLDLIYGIGVAMLLPKLIISAMA
ncbi:MAG: metalloprotease family protein [Armatimonadetes bacterium]|nr:metalloprotease family protein [Armatimonadota bacterium]